MWFLDTILSRVTYFFIHHRRSMILANNSAVMYHFEKILCPIHGLQTFHWIQLNSFKDWRSSKLYIKIPFLRHSEHSQPQPPEQNNRLKDSALYTEPNGMKMDFNEVNYRSPAYNRTSASELIWTDQVSKWFYNLICEKTQKIQWMLPSIADTITTKWLCVNGPLAYFLSNEN